MESRKSDTAYTLVPAKKTVNNNAHPHLNMNSSTPIPNKMIVYCHKTTPIKARIQDAINFLSKKGINGFNEDVFWSSNISHATGYKILKLGNSHILKNNSTKKKTKS